MKPYKTIKYLSSSISWIIKHHVISYYYGNTQGGSGALHVAAVMGHDEIVQELLDAGAAPDMQDRTGNTALHEAVRWRHGRVVKILMNSDCRINVRNEQGQTPMDIARRDGFNEIVALLTGLEVRLYGSVLSVVFGI